MPESESHPISLEKFGEALVIHFIRPNARNPLSVSVLEQLHQTIDTESKNPNFKKIIFTGTGDVFASGANLREIALVTKDTAREFALRGQTLMKKIADAPQMTIAAVNGYCFGGALDLALACDKRIASPNAVFSHPGANLGIMTGWGGTQRLPRLVGEAKALEMFLTAKRVDAAEALQIGLIDEIAENPLAAALGN
jgi:enoyl-CoA hydratase